MVITPRTSHDIDIKLGPITKLDKGNRSTSKEFDDDVTSANCGVVVFFRFMDNLRPSESLIPDGWCIKLIFSLIVTFYLTEPENSTKKSLTQLLYYCFE